VDGRIWPSSSSTSDGAGDADARHGHVNFGTVIRGAPGELAAIARAEAAIGDTMRYQKAARRAGVDMGLRIRPRA
jgi:hypothetical protein